VGKYKQYNAIKEDTEETQKKHRRNTEETQRTQIAPKNGTKTTNMK
jgi:hypothetical protein